MQINSREEDLTRVFDRTWKANHNDDIKKMKEKEKKFIDRLFDINKKEEAVKPVTPSEQLSILQGKMDAAKKANNQMKINDIKRNFN